MLDGRLEAITSSGYVEGWAYDGDAPLQPLIVSVLDSQGERAKGIANLYRSDLAEACYGTGWCGFRLKLCGAAYLPPEEGQSLWATTHHAQIYQAASLPVVKGQEPGLFSLEEVLSSDPTIVHSIEQLRGCDQVFKDFIRSEGVGAFVRCAHLYVLGQAANTTSLALYSALLRAGTMSPFEVLRSLYESDEFRSDPGLMIAPPRPGFVFRLGHTCPE